MKFILLEDIFLYEDIEGMKKYYPNIGDDMFMQYIELDPTYKQGSTSAGKYAKWILNLANKGKLENIGHVKDVLMRFEEEKKNLVNKDIMKYKSMEDLENALSVQSNKLELSDRQKERRIRNDYQDAELIAADDNWEVWIPHSYNASCTLGKGTKWCTAYSRDDRYYKQYTDSGDLIIFINKKDPTEKYQLHIETDSFMDKKDYPTDFISFLKERLSSLIQDILIKKYPILKKLVDFDGTWVYDEQNRIISRQLRDKVKKVIISDDVTSIRNYAFTMCRNLTSITIPNNITSIGVEAFFGCHSLTSIIIPDSVTSIGAEAFAKCDSLTSATIGSGVIRLRDYVFYGCSSLTNITLGSNVVIIREGAFYHCDNLTNITFQGTRVQWFEISKGVDWNYKTGNYTVHCTDGDISKHPSISESLKDAPIQQYTSANTSINSNKLPTIFHLVAFKPETINLDYGGGKFDNATDYLSSFNVTNLIYDPFNRSAEHNKKVLDTISQNGGADTATCSNVLNVIKEPEVRKNVIEHIESLLKPSGVAYFTVYEGTKERNEHPTKAGYQLNRPTSDYVQEIVGVFNNVMRKGKLIIARN